MSEARYAATVVGRAAFAFGRDLLAAIDLFLVFESSDRALLYFEGELVAIMLRTQRPTVEWHRAAIATGAVDYVLPLAAIAPAVSASASAPPGEIDAALDRVAPLRCIRELKR